MRIRFRKDILCHHTPSGEMIMIKICKDDNMYDIYFDATLGGSLNPYMHFDSCEE